MASSHVEILARARDWLAAGERVWLCTVVATWGSSPRPVGSWLALSESGKLSGSVSGGCLEEDLIRRCTRQAPDRVHMLDYGVTDHDREHYRLPCGGSIRLLVEPLAPGWGLGHVEDLLGHLERRQGVSRRVDLNGAAATLVRMGSGGPGVEIDADAMYHRLVPECRLLLVGAGEVAAHVARFATAADFGVTLCEPRDTFADGWSEPDIPLVRALPDDLVVSRFGDSHSAVLALAHDPRVDDMALLAALASEAFYVGAMGSHRTSASRRLRLAELGVSESRLGRLKAPVGVNIPSKTPAEIAISVVAALIEARHHLRAAATSL